MNNKLVPVKVKKNKSLQYLEELKKICIKNGSMNINTLINIWKQVPDKVKIDILPIIIKENSISKNESGESIENANLVGNLWMYTPKKIQEATIEKVISSLIIDMGNNEKMIELENLNTLLYATQDKRIISKKIGKILNELNNPQIINVEEAYKEIYNELPEVTDYSRFNVFRMNMKKHPIKLSKKGIELLSNKINNEIPIILEVRNVGELSNIEIQNFLDRGFNIQYIRLKGIEDEEITKKDEKKHVERLPYNLDTYIKCREKIDKIIKKVGYTINQKELFVKIVKEISTINFSYKCEESEPTPCTDFNNMYAYRKLFNSCSNLEGLITENTVCEGYVEIINNIMSCYGIESISVISDHELGVRHIWNQVKLDGVWYNADVTYDAENIKNGKQAYWLLRSDKDFLTDIDGKSFYMRHLHSKKLNSVIHRCPQSVPYEEVNMYLNKSSSAPSDNYNSDFQEKRQSKKQNDVEIEF